MKCACIGAPPDKDCVCAKGSVLNYTLQVILEPEPTPEVEKKEDES
jgi:hypothetical protein